MNIELQIFDNESRPFPQGTQFTLLGNGDPLATNTTDERGIVSFSLEKEWTEGLSVRLAALPGEASPPPKLKIKKR